jgi:hypothetical protein
MSSNISSQSVNADETIMNEERTYTIRYGADAIVHLTQQQMDAFIDAAGAIPAEPDELDARHPLAREEDGPDVITVSTSDGAPFSYHGQRLPQATASWVLVHAMSEAIRSFAEKTPGVAPDVMDVFRQAK